MPHSQQVCRQRADSVQTACRQRADSVQTSVDSAIYTISHRKMPGNREWTYIAFLFNTIHHLFMGLQEEKEEVNPTFCPLRVPLACAPRVCVCAPRVCPSRVPLACASRACATYAPPLCVCPSYQEQSLDMLMWVVFVAFVAGNCSYLPLDLWFNVFGTYYAYVGLHGQKWKRDHVASKLKVAHNRVM